MNVLKIVSTLILACLLFSCEDDPVVEPVYTDDDNCTGSYCKLSFPDSTKVASTTFENPALF